jgi:hypothetical protein
LLSAYKAILDKKLDIFELKLSIKFGFDRNRRRPLLKAARSYLYPEDLRIRARKTVLSQERVVGNKT